MPPTADPTDLALDHLRAAAALLFWRAEAIRVRPDAPFELASGKLSPIYVNCRRLISEPAFVGLFTTVARLQLERAGAQIDVFAGGETAGIPYAGFLAGALGKPMVYVRKKAKGYGMAARVEGHVEPGSRTLLVEDLITDGGSKVGFLDALAAAGAEVSEALVVFDRQQGGKELLAERGVRLHAVTDRETTLRVGVDAGLLTDDARQTVEDYFRDPDAWMPPGRSE